MGVLSNIRANLRDKKQKRINEEEIEKVLKELNEIDSNSIMDYETKNLRRQYIVTKFALLPEKHELDKDAATIRTLPSLRTAEVNV